MDTKIKSFRLPAAQLAKIEELSKSSGVSASEIIRACITRALPYVETVLQHQSNPGQAGQ